MAKSRFSQAEREPAASTIRWRKWKERQKRGKGEQFIPFPIDDDFVALLIDHNAINPDRSEDPAALAAAIRLAATNAFVTKRR